MLVNIFGQNGIMYMNNTLIKENTNIGFDLENAIKCVESYSSSTKVQCMIIGIDGEVLHITSFNNKACEFCEKVRDILGNRQSCSKSHLYGSYQAERFGGKYIFFCPMGLTHWTSPIMENGTMKGAVLGGPVQMMEPDEFLIEELIRKHGIDGKYLDEIKQYIKKVPIVIPEVVNNLSELLFIVALFISDIKPSRYLEESDFYEQQSHVAEYLNYINTMGGDDQSLNNYPLEKERELLSLISIGDKAGSQKVLNEIFGHIFFSSGNNFEVIKARILELVVLLSRAAVEGGADVEQIFGLNYKYLNEIHSFKTLDELTYWLSRIIARFTDLVFNLTDVKHVDVIYKAMDYIKRNYMKKITLEEVASHVYLSPSYFSKIFKEEMKLNFNSYLNNMRIEVSKNLLMDDSINLADLSNLVGFEDQSYFSKVFKKLTGTSPGKYRESRGQLK